ncbi:hypothetical protein HPB50_010224 [Hyalomma asiaticum]|uniref:Uncharacterized protein n=1 Tax=Hyalomma asiaticum TaxID=266040 RepID=A0ACB7RQ98_HYAAI|nr:hypothetical protein HPB50_010224 [Hyalomma asiaticum]
MALARNLVLALSLFVVGPWASVTAVGADISGGPAIRLCGRRLADLVWMICMDRGGVHSHMDRRARVSVCLTLSRAPANGLQNEIIVTLLVSLSTVRRPFVIYRPSPPRRDVGAQGGAGDEDGTSSAEAVATTTAPEPAVNSARYHSSQGQYSSGGIVEECCRKSCSFSTLASYCARPSDGSSLDAFNLVATSGSSAASALSSSGSSESGLQRSQQEPSPLIQRPEPSTTTAPRVFSSSRQQTAHEVNREHNEVDNASPHRRLGAVSRHTTGRALLPSMPFLTSPEDDTLFATRPRIGTFSRHRPYWYVVQAAFNEDTEEER